MVSVDSQGGSLAVGTGRAGPGEVVRAGIPVGKDICGHDRRIPIVIVNGRAPGPVLWINSGTHGDEAEGAFSSFMLVDELDPEVLRGGVVLCPAMNMGAFAVGERGDPGDTFSYDMNRIYPGKADGYFTERLAAAHFAAMLPVCDLQLNVHSGGGHSYLAEVLFSTPDAASRELAGAMGPAWTLIMSSPAGGANPPCQLAAHGKAAVGVELGGYCRTLTKDFHEVARKLKEAYLNVMRHYGMVPGQAQYASSWNIGHQETVRSPAPGMWVARADLDFLQPMRKGEVLGWVYTLHGEVAAEVVAPCDGMIAGIRSRPPVMEGEWICFYGVVDEVKDDLVPSRAARRP